MDRLLLWHVTAVAIVVLWTEVRASAGAEIVPAGSRLEELWNEGAFTEGPAVAPDGKIYFSDIMPDARPGRVMKFDLQTGRTTVHCADSGQSNGLMFDRSGRLIAACGANHGKRALCEITADGQVKVLVAEYEGRKFNAPNDLTIHPDGSIYFSDPRYVGPEPLELDQMSVYRFEPAGSADRADSAQSLLARVTSDIEKPNGLGLSPTAAPCTLRRPTTAARVRGREKRRGPDG